MDILPPKSPEQSVPEDTEAAPEQDEKPQEIGGPKGPEPTRYGDWERSGRCVDF